MTMDLLALLGLINHYCGTLTVDPDDRTVSWDMPNVPAEVAEAIAKAVAACGPELLRIFDANEPANTATIH